MSQYKIISTPDNKYTSSISIALQDIEERVNAEIKSGWQPIGNLLQIADPQRLVFAQTMQRII